MKKLFITLALASATVLTVNAATATISDVHICCGGCVKGIAAAEANIPGLTATSDKDDGTVTLTADDTATLQKGADALVAAGYYGTSGNPDVKISVDTGAKNQQVKSITITGLHVCCGHCVKTLNEVLGGVPGVTGNTAAPKAKSFEVTGDFNDKAVFDALQKAGFAGHEE